MEKITPFLWFDNNAEEAVNFYTSVFKNSKIGKVARYTEGSPGPAGMVMTMSFELEGHEFTALNGGPHFKFTPAVSFFVNCGSVEEINEIWGKLAEGGNVLMQIDQYPFSERYGWVQDRFGISWQLILRDEGQKITPSLMFVKENFGKAEEAINFYTSIFKDAETLALERYGKGSGEAEGKLMYSLFSLGGQHFTAMESNMEHLFTFTPAISFVVKCETQEEVDGFWDKLSEGGKTSQCGWLDDRYGISWQIVPTVLMKYLSDGNAGRAKRVMEVMLKMTKLDIPTLKKAYEAE